MLSAAVPRCLAAYPQGRPRAAAASGAAASACACAVPGHSVRGCAHGICKPFACHVCLCMEAPCGDSYHALTQGHQHHTPAPATAPPADVFADSLDDLDDFDIDAVIQDRRLQPAAAGPSRSQEPQHARPHHPASHAAVNAPHAQSGAGPQHAQPAGGCAPRSLPPVTHMSQQAAHGGHSVAAAGGGVDCSQRLQEVKARLLDVLLELELHASPSARRAELEAEKAALMASKLALERGGSGGASPALSMPQQQQAASSSGGAVSPAFRPPLQQQQQQQTRFGPPSGAGPPAPGGAFGSSQAPGGTWERGPGMDNPGGFPSTSGSAPWERPQAPILPGSFSSGVGLRSSHGPDTRGSGFDGRSNMHAPGAAWDSGGGVPGERVPDPTLRQVCYENYSSPDAFACM